MDISCYKLSCTYSKEIEIEIEHSKWTFPYFKEKGNGMKPPYREKMCLLLRKDAI